MKIRRMHQPSDLRRTKQEKDQVRQFIRHQVEEATTVSIGQEIVVAFSDTLLLWT